ncbi:MAG: LysR family transcriptional regulator [Clostridiales bacterium]|nr:LysR family transcriptional regulator [Clostridiales bacterium]
MTLTQLSTFIAIVESGSFTSAANQLGYAQSTVTTQIKQLETELNCLLFERLGKSLVLTPTGTHLVEYAHKMLQLEREILLDVSSSEMPSGTLNIGVSESLCYQELPKVLTTFKKQCPKVEIQLQFITHDTFPELLKKGKLDLVYTLNPSIDAPDLTLLYKKEETLGFYVRPDHPLAKKKQVTEDDLNHMPLLLTEQNCNFRMMLLEDLYEKHIVPQIVLGTSHKEILKQFAIENLGIAFIPDITAKKEMEMGELQKLNWQGKDFPIFTQVFVHKDKTLNAAINIFIKIVKQEIV